MAQNKEKEPSYCTMIPYEKEDDTVYVLRAQKKKTNALQVPLPRRLSWPCVSDLQLI